MTSNRESDKPLRVVSVLVLLGAFIIIARLFILQVFDHKFYAALAVSNHEIYKQLFPRRGTIFLQDTRTNGKEYPVAVNREYYSLYAVPRDVPADQISIIADFISKLLGYSEAEKNNLIAKLSKKNDPYEPIVKKISDEFKDKIDAQNFAGIHTTGQEFRYYPEASLAANVLGFTSLNEKGQLVGRYGVEGFLDNVLTGRSGFLAGEKGALGSIIPMADRTVKQAEDGADVLLTIDRNLQYKACERLRQGLEQYQAKTASLILMDPKTGAILAMCSLPDFNPNDLSDVKDVGVFNNTTIFTAYEPGSVFKPITMAAGLDLGLVTPFTTYIDTGEKNIKGSKPIHNALNKVYGLATMTNVLENSINTGMIFVVEKIGRERFKEYVEKFGFGKKTGINLDTEVSGEIDSLSKKPPIYIANGSFGQGLTATPLQVATAYAGLANGGNMPTPYIVDEIRHANGQIDKTEPETKLVISPNTAKLITAMLISVVEKTYHKAVGLKDYYIAGKTGTAQVASVGGYDADKTNHTFVGFFPATDPKFVLLVKYEEPQRNWAESTAAPVFKDVAQFVLDYQGIAGDR
jgi:stage V sporulation protein D (sporulation-specific penicillin-binding protein)